MGASESTERLNGTETTEEEERRLRESGRGSTGAAAIAIATAGATVAAWGISRMLSDTEESGRGSTGAAEIAIGAAVAAWGISKMLSDTEEKDEARMIRTHDQGPNTKRHGDQTLYLGSVSARPGLYAPTPEAKAMRPTPPSPPHLHRNPRNPPHTSPAWCAKHPEHPEHRENRRERERGEGSLRVYTPTLLPRGSGSVVVAGVVLPGVPKTPRFFPEGLGACTPHNLMTTKISFWSPPPSYGFKMNTDGGFRPTELGAVYRRRPSAYAGILRDHRCECILTFRGFIDLTDSLQAEILGILFGLELLVKLGMKGAILENDCDQAVFWIKGENKSYGVPKKKMSHCKKMINKCRKLATENNIAIHNIDRDANKCADELGRIALKERNQQVQTDLPDKVKRLVDEDKAAYYRTVYS